MDSDTGPQTVDLRPNGRNIPVTSATRAEYLFRTADHHLNTRIRVHCAEFCRGLFSILPQAWLRLFAADELHMLIAGEERHINVDDMQAHVVYSGEYHEEHVNIRAFWNVVRSFTDEERRNLVRFITSCPRPPLLGFRHFNPLICIQSAGHEARLPTASTCVNLLKLPVYDSEATLRRNLLYAISAGAGFELS